MKKVLIYCAAGLLIASCSKEEITGADKNDAASKMMGQPKIGEATAVYGNKKMMGQPKIGEPTAGKYVGGGGKAQGKYVGGGGKAQGKYVGGGGKAQGKYVGGGGKGQGGKGQ